MGFALVASSALVVLAGAAATFKDSFRAPNPGPDWMVTESSVAPRQGGGTLRFSLEQASSDDPEIAFGGYFNRTYALDYAKPWSISWDYSLPVQGLTPGARVGALTLLGVGTGGDAMERIYAPIVYRSTSGVFLGLITVDGDSMPVLETIGQAPASGRMQASYLPGGRRLQIAVNGTVRRTIRNAVTGTGIANPGVWGIGCLVWDASHSVEFTNGVTMSRLDVTGAGVIARPDTP
jgi:hypothetical protein